jgi:hypothetical protein
MPIRFMTIWFLALALSGCGLAADAKINGMNEAQIASASDSDVCRPNAGGAVVYNERQKRGLGDCTPAHLKCKDLGYAPGSSEYLQCRQMFMQKDIAADAAYRQTVANATAAIKNAYPPPPPIVRTTCQPGLSGSMNCTSQ